MGEPTGRGQNTNPSVPAYWGIRGPIPVVGQVDITPSLTANEVISVFAGIYNLLASTGNIVLNGVLATGELVELGIDVLDSHWDSSFTFTGNGIRQDIYTFEAVIGANPQLVAEGLACISESVRYFLINNSASVKTFNNLIPNQGYSSFGKLKKSIGSAGKGNDWHHIVEQSQIKKSGFSPELINNTSNVIAVDHATHMKITGYYASTQYRFTNGLSVRNWLAGQSYEAQYEFGLKTLRDFGVIK